MKNILYIIVIINLILDCNQETSINNAEKRNKNWAWIVKGDSKDGDWVPVGTDNEFVTGNYTLFYSNGNIYEKGTVLNEIQIDTVFTFDINENLIKYKIMLGDSSYDYIVKDGNYTSNHWKTGGVLETGKAHNHILGGNWTRYYESGNIEFRDTIIGKRKTRTEYFESGQIKSIFHFMNGKKDGIVTFYFKNGNLNEKKIWINGQENGFDSLWFENGQLNQISNNKNGLTNGYCEIWYQNGNYKFEGNFTGKLKQGECKKYSENGIIQTIVSYKNDIPNGVAKIYNENGKLKEIANYKNGLPNGKVETYENGELTQIDHYKDGELIKTE